MADLRVILVGAGKMGGALREAWRQADDIDVVTVDPAGGKGILTSVDRISASFIPDVVVFAVKPQAMEHVAPAYRHYERTLFLSIAAGTTLKTLEKHVGQKAAVVRAMPNLPATVGRGVAVCIANGRASQKDRLLADRLLACAGHVYWIKQEKLMDAVTAVSGSGPAYVFYLTEALAEAGVKAGLPETLAARLARHTVEGSAALLQHSKDSPDLLRESVTSKGGTTEAALEVLMGAKGLAKPLERAVAAAVRRSHKLSK